MHKDLYKIIGTKPEKMCYIWHTPHNTSSQEAETQEFEFGS